MGVPQFFRYLSEKYPRIMVDCVEELVVTGSEPVPPKDISPANPNKIEFDNLYLDMNGIIHPCTHPEDAPAPTTEEEMFSAVFDYIDRIVSIVRPRKLLYMAIDGVAPRAKINQQRSRRFRAAQEAELKAKEAEALKADWRKQGLKVSKLADSADWIADIPKQLGQETVDVDNAPFDSNVITPGTPFMERLAVALKEYASQRIAGTPGWENLRVLFSDASVPGEGEHKIAEYIRVERATPGYDPNISHVLYGLDADLIMLALATHEVRFSVLREEVFQKRGANARRSSDGNVVSDNTNANRLSSHEIDALMSSAGAVDAKNALANRTDVMLTRAEVGGKKPFQFLHVNVLREYLDLEFRHDVEKELEAAARKPQVGAPSGVVYDLENVIDDFVFLCFFVGNDFLPHLPTLDIREGAIDYLMEVYKTDLPHVGYLTSGAGDVDFTRVKRMLSRVGTKEDLVFQERMVKDRATAVRDVENRKRAAEAKERKQEQDRKKKAKLPRPTAGGEGKPAGTSSEGAAQQEVAALPVGGWEETVALGRGTTVGKNQAVAGRMKRALEQRKAARRGGGASPKEAAATASASSGRSSAAEKHRLGVSSLSISKTVKSPTPAASGPSVSKTTPTADGDQHDNVQDSSENTKNDDTTAAPGEEEEEVAGESEERTKDDFDEELKQRLDAQKVIENPSDNVRLGESGWKERYYLHKFNWTDVNQKEKDRLFHVYLEGLYWVMKYYYVGCVSWGWYYPFHYAPFASDIVQSSSTSEDIHLDIGKPFQPFTQLQAVMPASSGALVLPKCYSKLMSDPESPIIDYYPAEFELDLNGKRFAWQGVALLPFIDEKRLSDALAGLESQLTESEKKRNSFGHCLVMCNSNSSLGKYLDKEIEAGDTPKKLDLSSELAEGQLFGSVVPVGLSRAPDSKAIAARFELPEARPHTTALLPGSIVPPAVLDMGMKAECAQRGGWRPARHGSLGRAARELGEMRKQRLGGGRGAQYNRGNSRSRGRGFGQGYVQNQAPIHPQVNQAANAMFGGLGTAPGAGQHPSWMTHGYQNSAYPQQHYGYGSSAYYSQYGGQGPAQTYGPSGFDPTYSGQSGFYSNSAYHGQHQYGGGDYNFSGDPNYYAQRNYGGFSDSRGGSNSGSGSGPAGGSGLAGPTAMQMRQASNPGYNPPQNWRWTQANHQQSDAPNSRGQSNRNRGRGH